MAYERWLPKTCFTCTEFLVPKFAFLSASSPMRNGRPKMAAIKQVRLQTLSIMSLSVILGTFVRIFCVKMWSAIYHKNSLHHPREAKLWKKTSNEPLKCYESLREIYLNLRDNKSQTFSSTIVVKNKAISQDKLF